MTRHINYQCRAGFLGVAALLVVVTAHAQDPEGANDGQPATSPWGSLELLEGAWEGVISGKLGSGKGFRRYEFIMDGKFLMSRHISVRLPQEKSPQGDQHEELGVFSFDSEREMLVLREFMGEGVVVRSPCTVEGTSVVCVSEAVESGPGIRARLTLTISDRFTFTEKYEIAWSKDHELEVYFVNRWVRAARPPGWE